MNEKNVKAYFDKSGDEKIFTTNMVENDHGFASFSIDGEVLNIANVYGDGVYWNQFFKEIAKEHGCKIMRFATRRNPDAFSRKFGYKTVGYILEREVDNG